MKQNNETSVNTAINKTGDTLLHSIIFGAISDIPAAIKRLDSDNLQRGEIRKCLELDQKQFALIVSKAVDLIEQGADIHQPNNNGRTPFHIIQDAIDREKMIAADVMAHEHGVPYKWSEWNWHTQCQKAYEKFAKALTESYQNYQFVHSSLQYLQKEEFMTGTAITLIMQENVRS